MIWLDISVLLIACIFIIVGICKGFSRLAIKLGAVVPAVVIARLFGGFLGTRLFPEIIHDDWKMAEKMSSDSLDNVNESLAKIIGTIVLFVVLFIVFKIILSVISKILKKNPNINLLDRIIGAVFGALMALGAIYTFAFAVNIIAMVVTFFDSGSSIYDVIDKTVVFKYFF